MDQLFGLQHRRDIPPTKAFPRGKDANSESQKPTTRCTFWYRGTRDIL